MEKRARRREDGEEDDRLSELPEPILQQILCFLPQIDAVKTSLLSKPWRYLWTGRSKVDLCERECEPFFSSALDSILQRYYHQNLRLQELVVQIYYRESDSLLRKWIPRVMRMGVKKLNLSFISKSYVFNIFGAREPPQAFVSETSVVENLSLRRCRLTQQTPIKLKHLQTLVLCEVYISDQITLDNILSSSPDCCPLIQDVSLIRCGGLFRSISLLKNTAPTLKHFVYEGRFNSNYPHFEIDGDSPTLRSIRIINRLGSLSFPHLHNKNTFFSHHLTHLVLAGMWLSWKLPSFNLPCLEEMKLLNCEGINELHLSSISMKRLVIMTENRSFKATIDAPNIQIFSYQGVVPESITFTTTPNIDHQYHYWEESAINISSYRYEDTVASLWFHKLHQLLQASSQARIINLRLEHSKKDWNREEKDENDDNDPRDTVASVVNVECLRFQSPGEAQLCNLSFPDFLKRLFRVCRPRYIGPYILPPFLRVSEFLREKLIEERVVCCQHDDDVLEEVRMETRLFKPRATNRLRWEPARSSAFCCNDEEWVEVRFPLKWRKGSH